MRTILPILLILAVCSGLTALSYAQSDSSEPAQGAAPPAPPFEMTIHLITKTPGNLVPFEDGITVHTNDNIRFRISVSGTDSLNFVARDSNGDDERIGDMSVRDKRFAKQVGHLDDGTYTLFANDVQQGTFTVSGMPPVSEPEFSISIHLITKTPGNLVPFVEGITVHTNDNIRFRISVSGTDSLNFVARNSDGDDERIGDMSVRDKRFAKEVAHLADGTYTLFANDVHSGTFTVDSMPPATVTPPDVVIPSDIIAPSISSTEFTGARTIIITLSEPVPSITGTFFQSGDAELGTISYVHGPNTDTITLTTTNAAVQDEPYTISYPVISDMPGNILDAGTFTAVGIDTTAPSISSVKFTTANVIIVTLSEPVSNPTGVFTDSDLGTITHTTDGMIITLTTTNAAVQDDAYAINHPAISDVTGNELAAGSFTAVGIDTTAPTLDSAIFTNANLITLTFSEAINPPSADAFTAGLGDRNSQDLGTLAIDYTLDSTTLTLTPATPPVKHDTFTITPVGIKDIGDRALDTASIDVTFTADDTTDPTIMSSIFTGARTALITFSEPIENPTGTFIDADLGTITHVTDDMTITLTTTNVAVQDETYTISHPAISDMSGNILDSGTFDAKGIDTTAPSISSMAFEGSNTIIVTLSEPVPSVADEFSQSEGTDLGDISRTHVSNTDTVTLDTANAAVQGVTYKISYPAISDMLGNTLDAGTFTVDGIDITPPSISSMVFEGSNMIIVTLSEPVSNPTGAFTNEALGVITHTLSSDGMTITLMTANAAVQDTPYTINHPAISDVSKNTLKANEFTVTGPDTTAPSISNSVFTDSNTIIITLSETVPSVADGFSQSGSTELGVISRAHTPDTNTITLTTANEAVGGMAYMISHPSISDVSGNMLESGTFDITKPNTPSMPGMVFDGPNTIIVTFSEPVENPTGMFTNTDLGMITHVTDGMTITLTTTNNAIEGTEYTISHPAISVASGNMLEPGTFVITKPATPPSISDTVFKDSDTITVTLSEPVSNPTGVFTNEALGAITHTLSSDGMTITLTATNNAVEGTEYTISHPVISDMFGNTLKVGEFIITKPGPITLNRIEFIDAQTIRLTFDKPPTDAVQDASSFTLSEATITDVSYDGTTMTLVLNAPLTRTTTIDVSIPEITSQDGSIFASSVHSVMFNAPPPTDPSLKPSISSYRGTTTITNLDNIYNDFTMGSVTRADFFYRGGLTFTIPSNDPTRLFFVLNEIEVSSPPEPYLYSFLLVRQQGPSGDNGDLAVYTSTLHDSYVVDHYIKGDDGLYRNRNVNIVFYGDDNDNHHFTISNFHLQTIPSTPSPIISSIYFNSLSQIDIVFDKPIRAPSDSFSLTPTVALAENPVSVNGATLSLSLPAPVTGISYTLNIPEIVATDGSVFLATTRTITPHPTIQSTSFNGPSQIDIVFNKPISSPSGTFAIDPALTVSSISVVGSTLSLSLSSSTNTPLTTSNDAPHNTPYTISYPTISDMSGDTLVAGTFTVMGPDAASPSIEETSFKDSKVIEVTFTEPVSNPIESFVDTDLGVITHSTSQDGMIITLITSNDAIQDTAYTISHPTISDVSGNILKTGEFTITGLDTTTPSISSSVLINANTITITLSEPIPSVTGTFSQSGGTELGAISYVHTSDTNVITLTVTNNADHGTYMISYPAISDASGNTLETGTFKTILDTIAPSISDVKFTESDTIIITISEPIPSVTGTFSQSGGTELGAISYVHTSDTNVITLTVTNNAAQGMTYMISYPAISDASGNTLETGTFKTILDTIAPSISDVKFTESSTIVITLSEPVPSVTGTFSQSGGTELGAISYAHAPDTNTITLTTANAVSQNIIYTISHPAISDASGNTLESGNYDIPSTPEILSIIFANPDTIHITFDKKMLRPTADSFTISPKLPIFIAYSNASPYTLMLTLWYSAQPLVSYTITIPEIQSEDGSIFPSVDRTIEYTTPERQNIPKLQFAKFSESRTLLLSFDKQFTFTINPSDISTELPIYDTGVDSYEHNIYFDSILQTGTTYNITTPELRAQDGSVFPRTSHSIKYDPLPPEIYDVSFSTGNIILINFGEKITSPIGPFTISPTLPITRTSLSHNDYLIRLDTSSASAGTYEITIPAIRFQDGTIFSGATRDIVYDPPPVIKSIGFDDPNTIRVIFNKNIPYGPSLSRPFTISPELTINNVSYSENTFTLSLDSPASVGVPYIITIPRIWGLNGSAFLETTRNIQYVPPPPTIQSTLFNGSSQIDIVFDKPISNPSGTFAIDPVLTISSVSVTGSTLSLSLSSSTNTPLTTSNDAPHNTPYTVSYPAISDMSGNTLVAGAFTVMGPDTAPPSIEETSFQDSKVIKVTFNEPVSNPMESFVHADLGVITHSTSQDGMIITLTVANDAVEGTAYMISHPAISDASGNMLKTGKFTIAGLDTTAPSISSSVFTNANTITITLSEPVPSVTDEFSQAGGTTLGTISSTHIPNTNTITLTTANDVVQGIPYTISRPTISDAFGNALESGNYDIILSSPEILSIIFTNPNIIHISFDKKILRPTADSFTISPESPIDVPYSRYSASAFKVYLHNAADPLTQYTITIPEIHGVDGSISPSTSRTVEYIPPAQHNTPTLQFTTFYNDQTLALSFDKQLINQNITPSISPKLPFFSATTYEYGVSMRFSSSLQSGVTYNVTIPELSARDGSVLPRTSYNIKYDPLPPVISESGISSYTNTIVISFDRNLILPTDSFTISPTLPITHTSSFHHLIYLRYTPPDSAGTYELTIPTMRAQDGTIFSSTTLDIVYTPPLMIQSIEFDDSNTIRVVLDKNLPDLSYPLHFAPASPFTISPDRFISNVSHLEDTITISLLWPASTGVTYRVTIPTIFGPDGATFLETTRDIQYVSPLPVIQSISFNGPSQIDIVFDKLIRSPSGTFAIDPALTVSNVSVTGSTLSLSLSSSTNMPLTTSNDAPHNTPYTVSYPAISDMSGNTLVAGTFTVMGPDTAPPSIEETSFKDPKVIEVTFNEPVSNPIESFVDADLGVIAHSISQDGMIITLTVTNDAVVGDDYMISHPAISDMSGNTLQIGEFTITRPDTTAPSISSSVFTGSNTITIILSEPVPNVADEFTQSGGTELGVISRVHTPDTNTIILTTANVAVQGVTHTISYPAISDISGNTLETGTFKTKLDTVAPAISDVKFTESSTIVITLSEPVPSITGTFSQSGSTELGVISYVHTPDTNTIILTTANVAVQDTTYTISHPAISDASGNTFESGNYDIILSTPEISSIIFTTPRHIHITFDKNILHPTDLYTIYPQLLSASNPRIAYDVSASTLTINSNEGARPFTSYTITIPEIRGTDGSILPSVSRTIEYTPPGRQDVPTLQFAQFSNSRTLSLLFDKQLVYTTDSATISPELPIARSYTNGYQFIMRFHFPAQAGVTYNVTIPELRAQDGSILPGTSYNIEYNPSPLAINSAGFGVSTINIGFTKPIILPTDSFTISPALSITRTSLRLNDQTITLNYVPPTSAGTYELTMPTIQAQDGSIFPSTSLDFIFMPPPMIQSIGFDDSNTISIVFDKDIPRPLHRFIISPELPINNVLRSGDTLTLSLDSSASTDVTYRVTIPRILDLDGSTSFLSTTRDIQFNPRPLVLQSVEFDGPSAIRITFNKDIERPAADSFSISPTLPITDTFVSGNTLRLTLSEFARALPYTITIPDIADRDGAILSGTSQTVEFIPPDPPIILSSRFIDSTTLRIIFDKALAPDMLPVASSFTISPALDITELSTDRTALVLTLGSSVTVNTYTVTIPELRGQDGSIFSSYDSTVAYPSPIEEFPLTRMTGQDPYIIYIGDNISQVHADSDIDFDSIQIGQSLSTTFPSLGNYKIKVFTDAEFVSYSGVVQKGTFYNKSEYYISDSKGSNLQGLQYIMYTADRALEGRAHAANEGRFVLARDSTSTKGDKYSLVAPHLEPFVNSIADVILIKKYHGCNIYEIRDNVLTSVNETCDFTERRLSEPDPHNAPWTQYAIQRDGSTIYVIFTKNIDLPSDPFIITPELSVIDMYHSGSMITLSLDSVPVRGLYYITTPAIMGTDGSIRAAGWSPTIFDYTLY